MSINRSLKRLIREYEFLIDDMEDVLEIHKTANQELNRAIRMAKDDDIADDDFEKDEVEDEEVETFEDTPERKILKKLFRKIVFKCHPDRLPKDTNELERAEMQDLYEKAVLAHDRDNWGLMVVVAIKLDIKLPKEAEDMVGRIAEETESLRMQVSQITSSFAWQWYHSEEELRSKMIEDYLNTLKRIKQKNSRETKKILVIGHPRTGTGYTAKLLQSWGLDVQHEKMGEDGTSAWPLAATEEENPIFLDFNFKQYDWEIIIYCVRDPKNSLPSIAFTENTRKSSIQYRQKWGLFNANQKSQTIVSINSILAWDTLINKMKPDHVFRVEDGEKKLFNFLKNKGIALKEGEEISKNYNSRKHKDFTSLLKEHPLDTVHLQKINYFCKRYGYKDVRRY